LILPTFAFLISGASALGYQICWQRLLVIFAGGDIQAITIIVATFMQGLGAGALVGGWLIRSLSNAASVTLPASNASSDCGAPAANGCTMTFSASSSATPFTFGPRAHFSSCSRFFHPRF
jgi:hypothetical protein